MAGVRGQCAWASCVWLLGLGCAGDASQASSGRGEVGAGATGGSFGGPSSTGASGNEAKPAPGASPVGIPGANDAGSGARAAVPSARDAGVKLSPLDPTVTFDWQETRPGQGNCQPGMYSGTFTCQYVMAGADPSTAIEITGPIAITLTKSQSGEFLDISSGQLDGVAASIFGFTVKLEGRLDCSTNVLDAMAVDGAYGFGDPRGLTLGTGEGTLSGTLDRQTVTLSGNWNLGITDGVGAGGTCVGPWTAMFMP
jgi:hypothetical protein